MVMSMDANYTYNSNCFLTGDTITIPPRSETRKVEIYSTTARCPLKPSALYHEVGLLSVTNIIAEVETNSPGAFGSQESFMVSQIQKSITPYISNIEVCFRIPVPLNARRSRIVTLFNLKKLNVFSVLFLFGPSHETIFSMHNKCVFLNKHYLLIDYRRTRTYTLQKTKSTIDK